MLLSRALLYKIGMRMILVMKFLFAFNCISDYFSLKSKLEVKISLEHLLSDILMMMAYPKTIRCLAYLCLDISTVIFLHDTIRGIV